MKTAFLSAGHSGTDPGAGGGTATGYNGGWYDGTIKDFRIT